MGRANSASAEDDLIGLDEKCVPTAFHLHAPGTRAIKDEAVHQTVRPYSQVQAMSGLRQVAHGRTDAHAIGVIERGRADASGLRVIVVGAVGKTGSAAGVVKGNLA